MSQRPATNGRTYVPTGQPPGRRALPDELKKKREHGTRARYLYGERGQDRANGCRCDDCGDAAWKYELKRRINKKRGHEPFIDPTETREHLQWLSSQGIGSWTIAERSGVSRSTIQRISSGRAKRIRPEMAEKLLAINLSHAHPNGRIHAKRALELLAECKREGIAEARIARQLGLKKNSLQLYRSQRMSAERAARIEAACLELLAPIHAQRDWDARRQRDYRKRMAMEDG